MDFEKGKVTNEFSALSLYEGALILNTFSSKCYCERTTFVILYTKHKCATCKACIKYLDKV